MKKARGKEKEKERKSEINNKFKNYKYNPKLIIIITKNINLI